MSAKDVGAAFPVAYTEEMDFNRGMTLRDYFAASAIQGLAERPLGHETADNFAARAYDLADAMLEARKQ